LISRERRALIASNREKRKEDWAALNNRAQKIDIHLKLRKIRQAPELTEIFRSEPKTDRKKAVSFKQDFKEKHLKVMERLHAANVFSDEVKKHFCPPLITIKPKMSSEKAKSVFEPSEDVSTYWYRMQEEGNRCMQEGNKSKLVVTRHRQVIGQTCCH